MKHKQRHLKLTTPTAALACAMVLATTGLVGGLRAQQPAPAGPQAPGGGAAGAGRGGRGGGGAGQLIATGADANKDGSITRAELQTAFAGWFTAWDTTKTGLLTQEQIAAGVASLAPAGAGGAGGGREANPADVDAMMKVLPATAPAKPARARKVLVLTDAPGFFHSSIPLAAKTIEAMGAKTGAWIPRSVAIQMSLPPTT